MKTLYQTKLNKLILLAHGITTFFLTMGLMAQLMSSGLPPMKSVPQIVLNLLVFIGGVVVFIKFMIAGHGRLDFKPVQQLNAVAGILRRNHIHGF